MRKKGMWHGFWTRINTKNFITEFIRLQKTLFLEFFIAL